MSGNTANPRVWANADVYHAVVGSTAPTDLTTAWAAAWKALGLLGEDGITEAQDQDQTVHYALGGILIRRVRSKHERTFTVVALEDTLDTFLLTNPGSTSATVSSVTTRVVKIPQANVKAFGLETLDGAIKRRILIARGEITEVGDRVIASDTELAMRELTITVYPASDGTLYTELTNDTQAAT